MLAALGNIVRELQGKGRSVSILIIVPPKCSELGINPDIAQHTSLSEGSIGLGTSWIFWMPRRDLQVDRTSFSSLTSVQLQSLSLRCGDGMSG